MTMTAAGCRWVLLEPYVFRGDDDKSFPDDTVAPIKASGTTSWGADFRIAFSLADPPSISRLYAQLPGFPDPFLEDPLKMVASHRHLALLVIFNSETTVQDFFIFKANGNNPCSSSLIKLPPCTERWYDSRWDLSRRKPPSNAPPRLLHSRSMGLWCGGGDKGEEFVVAELVLRVSTRGHIRTGAVADICLLRSSFTDDDKLQLGRRRKWDTTRVEILSATDDLFKLSRWITHAVIPFQRWLCWISYHQGILFCDVSKKVPAPPAVSFFGFPEDEYSLTSTFGTPCSGNGGVSVVDHGRSLKFAYVARHDKGPAYGPLKPGTGFIITCYTLVLSDGGGGGGGMGWNLDYTVTSDQLPVRFQQGLPMYPQVDIDRPHVVHFLFIEFQFRKAYTKMSVLSIDMIQKTVESCCLNMDGNQPNPTEDKNFFLIKCHSPCPARFLSCEIPRFCYISRKRKDME